MTKFLTALSCAVFIWTLWDASSIGIYAGVVDPASFNAQCRYISARGFFEENKAGAIAGHSNNSKWCPSTFTVNKDKLARNKLAQF